MTHELLADLSRLSLSTEMLPCPPRPRIYKIPLVRGAAERRAANAQALNGVYAVIKASANPKEAIENYVRRHIKNLETARRDMNLNSVESVTNAGALAKAYSAIMSALVKNVQNVATPDALKDSYQEHYFYMWNVMTMLTDLTTSILLPKDTDYMQWSVEKSHNQRVVEALAKILNEYDDKWIQSDEFKLAPSERKAVLNDSKDAITLMDDEPSMRDQPLAHALWYQDLLKVGQTALMTHTTGARNVCARLRSYQNGQASKRKSTAEVAAALNPPKLSPHMDVVYDLVETQMDLIQEKVAHDHMLAGTFVKMAIDLKDFGLGRAEMQCDIRMRDTRLRNDWTIKWYLGCSPNPVFVKAELAKMRPFLPCSAEYALRSKPEVKRFLYWLDSTLSNEAKERAKTWPQNNPAAQLDRSAGVAKSMGGFTRRHYRV